MQYEIDALVIVDANSVDEAYEKAGELAEMIERLNCGGLAVLEGIEMSDPQPSASQAGSSAGG